MKWYILTDPDTWNLFKSDLWGEPRTKPDGSQILVYLKKFPNDKLKSECEVNLDIRVLTWNEAKAVGKEWDHFGKYYSTEPDGEHYHLWDCKYIQADDNPIEWESAEASGLQPCKICIGEL